MITQIARQTGGSVRVVCAALELPRSSFYHAAAPTQSADVELGPLIEAVFKRHRRRYGYRRIGEELSCRKRARTTRPKDRDDVWWAHASRGKPSSPPSCCR